MRAKARSSQLPGLAYEALGSFALVLVGAGAACLGLSVTSLPGRVGTAVVCCAVLAATVWLVGRAREPYLNPATTLAAWLAGHISAASAVSLVGAELLGGILAGLALRFAFPGAIADLRLGAPALAAGVPFARGVALEGAIALAWTAAAALTIWRARWLTAGAAAMGVIYGLGALSCGPLTGATGNPARAFGPAFAAGSYVDQLVYWVGPLCGAAVVGLAVRVCGQWLGGGAKTRAETNPEWALSYYKHGLALYRRGQLEEAAQHLAWAAELNPEWPEPYYYLGVVCQEIGEHDGAHAFFDVAVRFRNRQAATSETARR